MIVTGHNQNAALGIGAIGVAVAQRVTRPVDAGAFAVPHAEHTIDFAVRVQRRLLAAKNGGRAQILVHGGHEGDLVLIQPFAGLPEFEVQTAQRRTTIARHEARGVQPGRMIASRLIQHDADERLGAGQKNPAFGQVVTVGELVIGRGRWRVQHGLRSSCSPRV